MTIARQRFGKHLLKTGIVLLEWKSIASQRLASTHFPCNGYAGKSQRVATVLTHVFMVKAKTECQLIVRGGGLYSVLPKL
jgi:hypothetical protein